MIPLSAPFYTLRGDAVGYLKAGANPSITGLNTGDMTVDVCVYVDGKDWATWRTYGLIGQGDAYVTWGTTGWSLALYTDSSSPPKYKVYFTLYDTAIRAAVNASWITVTPGWLYIRARTAGNSAYLKFYHPVGSATGYSAITQPTATSAENLVLGAIKSNLYKLGGAEIAYVQIWKRDVGEIYRFPRCPFNADSSTVGRWVVSNSYPVLDSSGKSNHVYPVTPSSGMKLINRVAPGWTQGRRRWFYVAGEPGEITGQAAVALANLSPSAAGTVDIAGAAAATLANLTGQSAGAVEILGAAGTALANVASQAAGIVDIAGSGAANLAELLPSAEGSVTAAGAAAITLAGTTGAATASIGEAPITGQGEVTLANPAAQGTGGVAVSGAGNITLAGLTGQAAGAVSISGAAGVTLAGMVELAAGQASISGSAAEQFAEMVSAAAGVVVGYIPATQYIGLSLARRSFEWHISERAKDL